MAHTFIFGQSSTGKTTHILRLARQAMRDGHGVFYLDTKGHGFDVLKNHVPKRRTKHTTIFDTSREEVPLFNPLEDTANISLTADLFLETIKDVTGYSGTASPVMDMYLFAVFASLAEAKEPLLGWRHMLTNQQYRASVLSRVSNREVLDLWAEYGELTEKDKRQERSSSYNKAFILLANETVRRVFSSPVSNFDREAVVNGGVMLVKIPQSQLSKGRASALASSLLSFIYQGCLSRKKGKPLHLFIDDAHLIAPSLLSSMMIGAGEFNVDITLSMQFLSQVPKETLSAIIGNAGHMVVFRTSMDDGKELIDRFGSNQLSEDFHKLADFTARQFPFRPNVENVHVAPLGEPDYPKSWEDICFVERTRGITTRSDADREIRAFYERVGKGGR